MQIHRLSVCHREVVENKMLRFRLHLMILVPDEISRQPPAAGYVNGASLNNRGSNGNYWSSSFNSSASAWRLNFNSSEQNVNTNNRSDGLSVRAVRA